MQSEAQKRALEKYQKSSRRQILVTFYPSRHGLYEAVMAEGEERGGANRYLKELAERDLRSRGKLGTEEIRRTEK